MKRKKVNQDQWTFEGCVQYTLDALGEEDRRALIDGIDFDWHSTLGRWIRNECGLWAVGTDRCVADIVREYKAGNLKSKYLEQNQLTHPELSFDLGNASIGSFRVDNTLQHPDNCSAIIIETTIQRLRDGTR